MGAEETKSDPLAGVLTLVELLTPDELATAAKAVASRRIILGCASFNRFAQPSLAPGCPTAGPPPAAAELPYTDECGIEYASRAASTHCLFVFRAYPCDECGGTGSPGGGTLCQRCGGYGHKEGCASTRVSLRAAIEELGFAGKRPAHAG